MTTRPQLSVSALAALKADLLVSGRWRMVSANVSEHVDDESVTHQHVTVTLACDARSLNLVLMLEGVAGSPATSCQVYFRGTPFLTTDAALIAHVEGVVPALAAARDAELLAALTAEVGG